MSEGLHAKSRLDLHIHSNHSDGRYPPEEVLRRASVGGIDVLPLTDHDQPPALKAGPQVVAGRTIRVLHGVEVSAMSGDEELHLLVYFPGEMPEEFRDRLMKGIVGVEIEITRLEGKFKLSQNRSDADRAGVIAAPAASTDQTDRDVAEMMSQIQRPH